MLNAGDKAPDFTLPDADTVLSPAFFNNDESVDSVIISRLIFELDLSVKAPGNFRQNAAPIPLDSIIFIGLTGDIPSITKLSTDCAPSDTGGSGSIIVLHDDGAFGDADSGDNIWSRSVVFNDTVTSDSIYYKYGAHYRGNPNVDKPMDNEAAPGKHHSFELK